MDVEEATAHDLMQSTAEQVGVCQQSVDSGDLSDDIQKRRVLRQREEVGDGLGKALLHRQLLALVHVGLPNPVR